MLSANQIKYYRSLKQKKYRHRERKFLIEGMNLCQAALESRAQIECLLFTEDSYEAPEMAEIRELAERNKVYVELVPERVMKSLSEVVTPQGVLAVVHMPAYRPEQLWEQGKDGILVLDTIADPGNLGTILRTAEWFGIRAVVCSQNCADVFSGKVQRAAAGSYFYLPLILHDVDLRPLMEEMVAREFKIFVADAAGERSYREVEYAPPFALIIGNERHGVENWIRWYRPVFIRIPGKGKSESLNAAVAAAILIAEAFQN